MPWNNNSRSNLSIGWFAALSLLLHVLLLWGVMHHRSDAPLPVPQQAANGIHINLMPYHVSTPSTGTAQRVTQTAALPATPSAKTENTNADNQTKPEPKSTAGFRERIMVKLRQALAAHFSYPLLARQRNWQGEVLLAFRLERDGRISSARIARSSGYGLLDHAALNALDRVGQLGEILPQSLTVELPVIYRLEG